MEPRPATRPGAIQATPPPRRSEGAADRADFSWRGIRSRTRQAWQIPFQSSGGALSTAGQLIFVGNSAGKFFALDPVSGKTLWESQLQPGVATPISYELDGKQYIAVMSGIIEGQGRSASRLMRRKRSQ